MRSYDRDGRWSTATVLTAMFLGFTIGFLACHELYSGMEEGAYEISSRFSYMYSKVPIASG